MSVETFDLVDEPWIRVLRADGTATEVSLAEVFTDAGGIVRLNGELASQDFAILRLLLAILHSAVQGPADEEEWSALRDDWDDVVEQVDAYLAERRGRFDLLHPEAPFFQVAGLRTAKDEHSAIRKIVAEIPDGHMYLSTRQGPGADQLSIREAARWLVHTHAFDTSGIKSGAVGDPRVNGGRGYPIGVGWTGQLGGVHLEGDTLRDTLLLNLMVHPDEAYTDDLPDLPPWDRDPLTAAEEVAGGREPTGPVDLYTWQSRRVRLVGSRAGIVGVVLAQGDRATPHNRHRIEPMSRWRYSDPQSKKFGHDVYMPLALDPAVQLWRGISALLPYSEAGSGTGRDAAQRLAPRVIQWAATLQRRGLLPPGGLVRTRAAGIVYGSNNSVVDDVVVDMLALPAALLEEDQTEARRSVIDAVQSSSDAVAAFVNFASNVSAAAGDRNVDGVRDAAREKGYAALDGPFRRWLTDLDLTAPMSDQRAAWHAEATRALRALADEIVAGASPGAWVGREVMGRHVDLGLAEAWFRAALGKALPQVRPVPSSEESIA